MAKTSGLASVLICDAGTLLTTPTNKLVFGITRNEEVKVTDYKQTKIDRDEIELPNMKNLMLSAESLQPSLFMFNKLVSFRAGNCDVQIVTLNGSVFQFLAASSPLGVEPTYIINDDYRAIKVDLEAAFPKAIWLALELAAQTNVAVATGSTPVSGRDSAKRRKCYPLKTESPVATEIFDVYSKRSLEIGVQRKDKVFVGGTNGHNISTFDRLLATAIIQTSDATFADRYNQEGKGDQPELLFKDGNEGAYYDQIQFAAETLAQKIEYTDGNTKSELTVTYKGAVAIELMALETGATKGDAVDGTGVAGGTLKFNY